jgi:transposase
MNDTQMAIDLAKSVFQVAVSHAPGQVHEQHRLSRRRFPTFFLHQPPIHVLVEACGSAHHWDRELQTFGHAVSLLPPAHVARYRQGNETDRADAKARGQNIATVALANRIARTAWRVWRDQRPYQRRSPSQEDAA